MSRAKNLQDADVKAVVEILDGWSERLTWEAFIEAIEKRLLVRYTRQALHKHARIQAAFAHRKRALAAGGSKPRITVASPALQAALDRADRLAAENQRLKAENDRLLEQFVRWAYNASSRGLDEVFLSAPLPEVDRRPSKVSRVGRALSSVSKKG